MTGNPNSILLWRKALRDAANYLEAHGWRQNGGDARGGPACMVSAIAIVCTYSVPYFGALAVLQRFLNARPMEWNNHPGRTQEEVVAALRACAEPPTQSPARAVQ